MKLKPPAHAAHRRHQLKSMLDPATDTASRQALGEMMRGYQEQGAKPSTGTRPAPRAHLVRQRSGGSTGRLDSSIDHMIATALVKGPMTSGVMSSLFGLSPGLTGR